MSDCLFNNPDREPLTDRQIEVLAWITDFKMQRGFPPSIAEISKAFGFKSPSGAVCHLKAIQRKGYIRREPGKCRALATAE